VVTQGSYAGHPNPTRGNKANTFNGLSPILAADPIECDFEVQGTLAHPVLATDPSSSDGIAEYTATNFGGAMTGDLLLAAYDNYIERVQVDATGTVNLGKTNLFTSVGQHPLDIVAMSDTQAFPGTIWVADHGTNQIYVYEPSDFGGGGPTAQPDETIKLAGDAAALGRNILNTTGAGQTRTLTGARGVSKTFVVKVWNNGTNADSYLVHGPGPATGFTVKYLKGASGSTDITAAVIAGTYKTASLAPGTGAVIRLVVTIGSSPPTGVRDWLITATSRQNSSAQDAVDAQIKT
jgi:hypothetical protein